MADLVRRLGSLIGMSAIVLGFCTLSVAQGVDESKPENPDINFIPTVQGFPLDHLSGSMALRALHSVLATQGIGGAYGDIVGISGSPFKVVYDSSEAFEPLRDVCPFDLLRNVAVRSGFPDAHWETGLGGEDLKELVKREIDAGRPLIAPFLTTDAYHGFNIISGYDYVSNQFRVQGAFGRRRGNEVAIPDRWDGPTMSPAGWATNPVFVLGEAVYDSAGMDHVYLEMAEEAVELLRGGTLTYGLAEGEALYMARPGPHEARYGLPAYDILAWDVEHAEIVMDGRGGEVLNFGLLWRIDAMVGLLQHDRAQGDKYTDLLKGVITQQHAPLAYELDIGFERSSAGAAELRDLFWHEIPDSLRDAREVLDYVDGSEAIVFSLPAGEELAASLKEMGRDIHQSPWGWVMVEDTPDKRLRAKMMVISLRSRDLKCLGLMERVENAIESAADQKWPPRKWRPNRLKKK